MPDNLYEKHILPDPSKPYIFHPSREFCYCLPHWHENIELLHFFSESRVICGRTAYDVKPGDITVFSSNALHSIPKDAAGCYECLIVDSKFCFDNGIDVAAIDFECVVRDSEAGQLYSRAVEEISAQQSGERFGAAGVKAAILTLMVKLCRGWSHPSAERETGSIVRRAIGYINSNLTRPMTVDEIAGNVSVSKYYLCREFRRETGFTVVRYINDLRCREAERLLRGTSGSVGEIARSCGFDNVSYFTRTFKAVTGFTPSEIRA